MTRSKMLTCELVLLILFVFAGSIQAQDLKAEFDAIGKAYDMAILNRDANALAKLYGDDGDFVLPDGRLVNKDNYIADTLKRKWETAQSSNQKVRAVADGVVIETGIFTCSGKEENGQPFRERTRFIATWVKKGPTWVLVAEQGTLIAESKK